MAPSTSTPAFHPLTGNLLLPVGYRRDGRPIWPILGGDGTEGGEGGSTDGGTGGAGTGNGAPAGENGFPANTPLEQMTADQREAYWKHQARKHEDRVKAFGGLTPEQLADLREKASKHDELQNELKSDHERALDEARNQSKTETRNAFAPKLVRAEFKAALAGRVPDEQLEQKLDAITGPLDLSHFLTDSDDVDTAKVRAFVENIAPAKGEPRKGPTATSHGGGTSTADRAGTGDDVASGHDLYAERHKKKAS